MQAAMCLSHTRTPLAPLSTRRVRRRRTTGGREHKFCRRPVPRPGPRRGPEDALVRSSLMGFPGSDSNRASKRDSTEDIKYARREQRWWCDERLRPVCGCRNWPNRKPRKVHERTARSRQRRSCGRIQGCKVLVPLSHHMHHRLGQARPPGEQDGYFFACARGAGVLPAHGEVVLGGCF